MAEPTQVQTAPTGSPREIKQEHEHEPTGLEALDFSILAELASKRPFEHVAQDNHDEREQEAKRPKTENHTTEEETSLEDGLALLVQNALSNVGDLVSKFNIETGEAHGSDPMDVDDAHGADARPAPVSFLSEPEKYVRIANTHALGNLALSLLLILLQQPIDDMSKLAGDADSGYGRSYGRLKRSFDATWQLFSDDQVLSADELEIQEAEARTLLELANIAKFGTWLVEGGLDSFTAADRHFAAVFRCQLSDLSAGLSQLYLGIRTHKTIESLLIRNGDGPSIEEVVQTIMLEGLNEPDASSEPISASQQELLTSIKSRKDVLVDEVKTKEPAALKEKYPTGDVLKSFSAHVRTTLASMTEIGEKLGVSALLSDVANQESIPSGSHDGELDLDDLSSFFEKTTSGLVQNALAGLTEETPVEEPAVVEVTETPTETVNGESKTETAAPVAAQTNGAKLDLISDYKELEALVAESTSNYVKTTLHGLSAVPYQPTVPQSTAETMAAQSPYLSHLHQHQSHHPYYTTYASQPAPEQQPPQPTGNSDNLPPNQTFPSAILYDKARQAALSKSSAHTRREGLHSTRRPWTQEEEKALMAGLDMVKGPHWSQILTLFGQNGTISDILKDRTQVQLKDKARNLKLFFLKTNSEMPYYLQAVTGELKTRAPTQAARKEAEERARMNSEEEQAKLQGIMALAGGLQHPPQQQQQAHQQPRQQLHHQARPPVTVAAAVGQSVVTPAQAASAAQSASSVQQQQHASHLHHTPTASMASTQQANVAPISRGGMIMPNTAQIKPESQMAAVQQAVQQASQPVPLAPQRPQTQLPPQVPRPQSQPQPQLQMQQHSPLQQQHSPLQHQQQQQQQQHPQTPTQAQAHVQALTQALTQAQPHTQMPAQTQAQTQQVNHHQAQPSPQPLQQQYHQQPQSSPHVQPSHSPALGQHHQTTPSQPGTPIASTQLQNGTVAHPSPTPTIPSTPTPSHLSQHISTPIQASPVPAYSSQPQQASIPAQTELHKLVSAPEATMSQTVVQDDEAAAEAALLEGLQAAVAQALAS
ncbi:telomere repeat binding factor-domain-containing protein [Trichoderma sp. SZMC 28011]